MGFQVSREEFERITEEEFDALPEEIHRRMENVHVVVEENDSQRRRRKAGIYRQSLLLGLYEGIPLSRRGTDYGVAPVLPDRITLFQRNCEAVSGSAEELRATIRDTLVHEIAHHFGMSEREVRDAGY
jgi:predicted Zn-dependent protease with MMP-like domain